MESAEVKAEDEVLESKDVEILVEIDALEGEKSVLDGSIAENLKVRKRGRPEENHDENKGQGCGESNGLGMKTGESEGGIGTGCVVGGSRKSKDLVKENGGVEEGKAMEEDTDGLGDVSKENCVSSSAAEGDGGKDMVEEDLIFLTGKGTKKSKVEIERRHSGVRKSKTVAEEKIRMNTELSITDDEDEGASNRVKGKKKNNNGASMKGSEFGVERARMEDKKSGKMSLRDKGKGECEGKEQNGTASAVGEGKAMEEGKDSLGDVSRKNCVSSSAADGDRGKDLEEEDIIFLRDKGKKKSKVETEQRQSGSRKAKLKAVEKMSLDNALQHITYDENRGKRKKKDDNGTSLEEEKEVGAEIPQMEDKKTEKRSSRGKGKGECEGKELNGTVPKTRVGLKRDENVGRIWEIALQL